LNILSPGFRIGGIIGGAVDAVVTKTIGKLAISTFIEQTADVVA